MAATSKRTKKNSGSAKKQANAKSLTAQSIDESAPSTASNATFGRFIYALVSFQQFASWYYANGTDGSPESRAAEMTRDIIRLERKYMDRVNVQLERTGRCPAGWVDCGGLCLEPGSICQPGGDA